MKKVYIAPMAGVTEYSYRRIMNEFNPDLIFTEMVSVNAIEMANNKTLNKMLRLLPNDSVQLFGRDIEYIKRSAKYVEELGVKHIDINMGCPMPKITKNGYGAAMLDDPEHARRLMLELRETLNPKTDLSMKIRIGYKEHKDPKQMARIAKEAECTHLTIHGRTREQMYSGVADWNVIKDVKQMAELPIIGNGDIFTAEDAQEKIELSDVDGVMLARGIYGNPWIIAQTKELLNEGAIKTRYTMDDKIDMAVKHLNYAIEDSLDGRFHFEIRKHLCWYLKGLKNASAAKHSINRTESYDEILDLLEKVRQANR